MSSAHPSPLSETTSRLKGRLIGILVIMIGAGLTYWNWHTALYEGSYYLKVAVAGPLFICAGLSYALFPPQSVDGPPKTLGEKITLYVFLALGAGIGFANHSVMDGTIQVSEELLKKIIF